MLSVVSPLPPAAPVPSAPDPLSPVTPWVPWPPTTIVRVSPGLTPIVAACRRPPLPGVAVPDQSAPPCPPATSTAVISVTPAGTVHV